MYIQFALITGFYSCKAYKPVVSSSGYSLAEESYISRYKDLAIREMKRTGIPASITLAQGMVESDYGRSSLAREANNHFGIKCHNGWTGPTMRHRDDRRNDCFRKYREPEESFYDHSEFLRSGSRYRFLFDLNPTDYKAWARGLKKAGYATNPDYANMLIRKIEESSLYNYDLGGKYENTAKEASVGIPPPVMVQDTNRKEEPVFPVNENKVISARISRVMETNRIQYIIVKDGDSKPGIEKEFNMLRWELSRYNELERDFTLVVGQILFLQPKRDKAEPGNEFHNFSEGDTMYNISQRYGIKLKSLYEMNRMTEGTEPEPGSKIWLRSFKPVD